MHKNIKTVAGCITRVTCIFTKADGSSPKIEAYCLVEHEYRAAAKEADNVLSFPAMEYGQHLYEVRADGKPVIHGHFLIRPSAFPHDGGAVDYVLEADLGTVDAYINLEEVSGPPGPRGMSAYEVALQNGFAGTEGEWLESLKVGAQDAASAASDRARVLAETAAINALVSRDDAWRAAAQAELNAINALDGAAANGEEVTA